MSQRARIARRKRLGYPSALWAELMLTDRTAAVAHPQAESCNPVFRWTGSKRGDGHDLFSLDRLPEVADKVVELARANHAKLVGRA